MRAKAGCRAVKNSLLSWLSIRSRVALELAVDPIPGVVAGDVGGHVLIEQHGVGELVGVFAEAADADLGVQVDVGIVDPEAHGVGGTVLIADDLLDVEVVDPLVLAGVAAQGEPLLQDLPGLLQVLAQGAVEDGGLSGLVPNELAGLGGELHDPALVHDHHAPPWSTIIMH